MATATLHSTNACNGVCETVNLPYFAEAVYGITADGVPAAASAHGRIQPPQQNASVEQLAPRTTDT